MHGSNIQVLGERFKGFFAGRPAETGPPGNFKDTIGGAADGRNRPGDESLPPTLVGGTWLDAVDDRGGR